MHSIIYATQGYFTIIHIDTVHYYYYKSTTYAKTHTVQQVIDYIHCTALLCL